jgi:signal transduction histidine kinase
MARLIDDHARRLRITRGKITLQPGIVPVAHVVEEAIESVRPLITQHEHSLSVTLGSETLLLEADRARLVKSSEIC